MPYLATYRGHSAVNPARVYVGIRGRSTGEKYFGPAGSGTVQVKVANGGGAGTPADIIISRELLWIAPVEGAG